MPALLEPEETASRIVAGIERSGFEIIFPWRFICLLKLLRRRLSATGNLVRV